MVWLSRIAVGTGPRMNSSSEWGTLSPTSPSYVTNGKYTCLSGGKYYDTIRITVFDLCSCFFPICRCIGDHRGDKQKFYPADCVRLLTRHEIDYIIALVSQSSSCGIDTSRIGSLKPLCGSTASMITATMLAVFCWDMQVWGGGRITWVVAILNFIRNIRK